MTELQLEDYICRRYTGGTHAAACLAANMEMTEDEGEAIICMVRSMDRSILGPAQKALIRATATNDWCNNLL